MFGARNLKVTLGSRRGECIPEGFAIGENIREEIPVMILTIESRSRTHLNFKLLKGLIC